MERHATMAIDFSSARSDTGQFSDSFLQGLVSPLLEHTPAGIALIDGRELRVLLANRQLYGMLDEPHRSGTIVGLRLPAFVPGAEELELERWVRQVVRSRRADSRKELRIDGLSRGPAYWDVTVVPVEDQPAGRPTVMLQAVDITETVLARQERARALLRVEQRAEQFVAALETISDGVVVVDSAGKVRSINMAGIAMLDLDLLEAPSGEAASSPAVAPSLQVDLPPIQMSLHGEIIRDAEHGVRRRDGETTWLKVSSAPLYDQNGVVRGAVAGLQDISKHKQLDQIKEDFLAVTAHELRTPVTALLGYTNLLVRHAEQGDWADRDLHALRMTQTQAQRLKELVDGLVDVSRIQIGTIELRCQQVDMDALARQAAASLRATTTNHIIEVDGPEQPVIVWGDPQRLDQVLTHLIGNALKYSPWGGTVHIDVWMDAEAHIAVMDAGIGIPEEALPQLFQRFYRATNVDSDRISGLGIGLYLVKEFVAAHGGRIEVQSAPDQGTTFEIVLPLHANVEADSQ